MRLRIREEEADHTGLVDRGAAVESHRLPVSEITFGFNKSQAWETWTGGNEAGSWWGDPREWSGQGRRVGCRARIQ